MPEVFCALCGLEMLKPEEKLWLPENNRKEQVHAECKEFFEASRPPTSERRKRWMDETGSFGDD